MQNWQIIFPVWPFTRDKVWKMPPNHKWENFFVCIFLWDCLKPTLATTGGEKDVETKFMNCRRDRKWDGASGDKSSARVRLSLGLWSAAGKSIFERIIFLSSLTPYRAEFLRHRPHTPSPCEYLSSARRFVVCHRQKKRPETKNVSQQSLTLPCFRISWICKLKLNSPLLSFRFLIVFFACRAWLDSCWLTFFNLALALINDDEWAQGFLRYFRW